MSPVGILPVNKPCGVRSTDCVEKIKRILGRKTKAGHGGTLDSTASGLLILLLGPATRLSNFIMALPKCYETEIQLGRTTSTDDASGEILFERSFEGITDESIDLALPSFRGWRMQKPPMISAVHVDGKRAHELTRSGQTPEIDAKPVYFMRTERISEISGDGRVRFRLLCSKGTYVRSFARDIGEKLGCGAHVSALVRSSVGPFTLEAAPRYDDLLAMTRDELMEQIVRFDALLATANAYAIQGAQADSLRNGQSQNLKQLRRLTLGNALSDKFLIAGDGIFSICAASAEGDSLTLRPSTNIFYGGTAEE